MSTIILYGTTFQPIINWDNVTQLYFKMDWQDLLADKATPSEWNRDRILVAILNVIEAGKLETLMKLLANRRDTLIDLNLVRKALQIEATVLFYEDGKFVLENNTYLEYLDNMAASTVYSGNVLQSFYETHRGKFSADEHALFVDYVQTLQNEKLKAEILDFIQLNGPAPTTIEIEDPASELLAELEEKLKAAEMEEELKNADLEEKKKAEQEPAIAQLPEADQSDNTGSNLQPSIVTAATVTPHLFINTGANDASNDADISPLPIKQTTPVVAPMPQVVIKPVSLLTRIANKWKALPTRYKLAAFGFAMLGIVATVLGVVFPPSLTVTVPLLKVSSSTLLTFGGAALTAVTLAGHAIHVSTQSAKTVASPISQTVPTSAITPVSAAALEVAETPSPIPSPVASLTAPNGLEKEEHDDEEKEASDAHSNSFQTSEMNGLDHCESTQTSQSRRSRSASSATILSFLQTPATTPTSASALASNTALPTPSSRPGNYAVPKLMRSKSMRTSREASGETVFNISTRPSC